MKTIPALILTGATASFAGATIALLVDRPTPAAPPAPPVAASVQAAVTRPLPRFVPAPVPLTPGAAPSNPNSVPEPAAAEPSPVTAPVTGHPAPVAVRSPSVHHPPVISRRELENRAAIVQRQTETRLRQLTEQLELTPSQQDHIFGIIARSSPNYHPRMLIASDGGDTAGHEGAASPSTIAPSEQDPSEAPAAPPSPVPTSPQEAPATGITPAAPPIEKAPATDPAEVAVESPPESIESTEDDAATPAPPGNPYDEIYPVLTPDQQLALAESITDRDRWWEDVLGELEAEHDELLARVPVVAAAPVPADEPTPAAGAAPAADHESAPVPANSGHAGGNLFDLLQP